MVLAELVLEIGCSGLALGLGYEIEEIVFLNFDLIVAD
jgi:hypothetical protein